MIIFKNTIDKTKYITFNKLFNTSLKEIKLLPFSGHFERCLALAPSKGLAKQMNRQFRIFLNAYIPLNFNITYRHYSGWEEWYL